VRVNDANEQSSRERASQRMARVADRTAGAVGAARSVAQGRVLTHEGVLALQRAAGNAAVGRLLARQPTTPASEDDLMDPFELTPEEEAQIEARAAQAKIDMRERVLAALEGGAGVGFLGRLRDLPWGQRRILQADQEFWARVRKRISGLAVWAVQVALQYGTRSPSQVDALRAAVHEGNWLRTRQLIMAYPDLKAVEGLRAVITHRFDARQAQDILAVIAEGGRRWEAGARSYQEAHYEAGTLVKFTGTRDYELVRLNTQLRVIVKIRLQDDPSNKAAAISDKAVARWEDGINRRWNGKFRLRNGANTLDVWFLPIFVYREGAVHHTVNVLPGEGGRSSEHQWHESDSADTAAHEFGHMIGNPDEYNLPGSMAEIPASMGLSDAEKRRSSWEGLTGKPAAQTNEGYDMTNLMGAHYLDASVRARHGWDVLEVFNAHLRRPGENAWTIELKK
jgi:hypothetical protein